MTSLRLRAGAAFLRLRSLRRPALLVSVLLFVEFLDEVVFGARETAWPLIRADLNLDYVQIGLLLSLPPLLANFIEMGFGILADMGYRRRLILGGGILFALASLATGLSESFGALMIAFIVFNPASGAFVSLSQAALMDHDPTRHEQNMARWTLAGSIGVFMGPLLLGLLSGNWRLLFIGYGVVAFIAVFIVARVPMKESAAAETHAGLLDGFREALRDLRRFEVLRWLVLLQFSDLMLDVLYAYLALYLVDVAQTDVATAGVAVAVWTGVGLLGDVLIIPLLERVRGLTYLRYSAIAELVLYSAFLLVPSVVVKIVLLGLLGMFNAGWYSVLQGQLYTAMPGRSGSVLTVGNVFGFFGALLPLALGAAAETWGLSVAMWLLLLGPVALLVGLPRGGGVPIGELTAEPPDAP